MRLLLLITALFSFTLSAATEYEKPQTPTELHALFAEYFESKDLNGLGTLFDENAVFILDAQGNKAKGRQAIKEVLTGFMQGDVEMITKSVSIHINGNIALIRSEWYIPNVADGTALEVMQYKDGGWVYIIDNPNGY